MIVDPARTAVGGDVRAALLTQLTAAADRRLANVLVIRGPAGGGKTWLVDRLLDRLQGTRPVRRAGFAEHPGRGLDPLWSLAVRRPPTPGLFTTSFGLDGVTASELSQSVIDDCPQGATLVVEDLHWADDVALAAVQLLIERTANSDRPFTVVVTVRDDHHGAPDLLATVGAGAALLVADVPPLTEDEAHAAVLSLGFARVDPQLVEMVLRVSGGNALHIIEGVRELVDAGAARFVGGRLTGSGDAVATLPRELWTVVARRLARTPEPVVVAAVALLQPFADDWSVAALVPEVAGVSAALAVAVELGLLEHSDTGYTCRHQLIARAAFDRLDADRARQVHARAAEHATEAALPAMVIATHLLGAGSQAPVDVLQYHGLGCLEALIEAGAWGAAGRLGDIIISSGAQSAAVCVATGLAHQRNADPERALLAYDEAIDLASAEDEPELLVTARCWAARSKAFSSDLRVPASLAAELDLMARSVTSPTLLSRIQASKAEILASAGLLDEAIAEAAAGVATAGEDDELLAQTCSSYGITLLSTLELARAEDLLRRARRHATTSGDRHLDVVSCSRMAWIAIARGGLDQAEELLLDGDDLLVRHGPWAERCLAAAAWCSLALGRGDLRDLAAQGERALRLVHRSEYYLGPFLVYPALIAGALAEGDQERVQWLVDDWAETGQGGQGPSRLLAHLDDGATEAVARELNARVPARRWQGEPNFANVGSLAMVTELAARCQVTGAGFDRLAATVEAAAVSDLTLVPTFPSMTSMLLADVCLARGDREAAAHLYRNAATLAGTIHAPLVQARALLGEAGALPPGQPSAVAAAQSALGIANRLGANQLAARATSLVTAASGVKPVIYDGSTPLAMLLTDVVSSTSIADAHGDPVYTDVIDLHDRLVRTEVQRFGGSEFDHTGDGLYAWFADPEAAVSCGQAIQRVTGQRVSDARLDVRVAVVYGDCYFRRGRPYGGMCNLAARVCALGGAGSLVICDEVRRRVGRYLPLRPLPPARLKGLAAPPPLFEVQR
ncbi:MAG: hypothetical protein R2761_10375 [Acidimicrobiales bacterium]